MSSRPSHQVQRLAEEKKLLQDHFGKERLHWRAQTTTEPKVEVTMTSNRNKSYTFRLYIPEDFPNSCPKLAVVSPKRLLRRNGELLGENCSEFHTLDYHDGLQTICHFHWADWYCGFRLLQVFSKAKLWMEAYENHLNNGKDLSHYLQRSFQPTEPSDVSFSWSSVQMKRLQEERVRLNEFYPGRVTWRNSAGEHTTVDIEIKTESENVYKLRAHLPSDYPNSCPTLAVVSPEDLRRNDGEPLPENSQEFRTLGKRDGKMTICHCSASEWTDTISICRVFTKGEIWVKAYESYLVKKGDFLTYLNEHVQSSD